MDISSIETQYVDSKKLLRPPLSIAADSPLSFAQIAMKLLNVGAAGVIDQHNHFLGFVTQEKLEEISLRKDIDEDTTYVQSIMLPRSFAVGLDDTLLQALVQMDKYVLDWLPIIDPSNMFFVGLLCRDDLDLPIRTLGHKVDQQTKCCTVFLNGEKIDYLYSSAE